MNLGRPTQPVRESPRQIFSLLWWRAGACDWLVAGLLLWMFLACCFPLWDSDLFWHLKTGEWILQNRTIPGQDLYTYMDPDSRWIDLHWGFQVGAATLYQIGGANLLILAKATILTMALGVGCFASGSKLQGWQRVLCWVLPAITISGRGYERPEIISLLCLAIWLAILVRWESRPALIWVLPVLQVFWINCHSLYILGLAVGACYAVDYIVRCAASPIRALGGIPQGAPSILMIAGILCIAAALVNPYFEEGALFPLVVLRKFTVDQQLYSVIGEFQPPINFFLKNGFASLHLDAEILLWVASMGSIVALVRRGRFSVYRTLLFAAFSYLAWKASRNTNIFSIVAGFVLSENVGELFPKSQVESDHSKAPSIIWIQRSLGVLLVLMVGTVVTGLWNDYTERIRPFRLGEARAWFAHDAARFMQRPGFPRKVFAANFGVAAVYSYHNAPDGKVFMDGRLEVCSRETFVRYREIMKQMQVASRAWPELLRNRDGSFPAVMLDSRFSRDLIEGALNTPGWRLVYADHAAAVLFDVQTADALHLPEVSIAPLQFPPPF